MLAYIFQDSSGNAVAPKLSSDGAIVVTNDSGTPDGEAFEQAAGAHWEIEPGGYLEIKKINFIGKTLYYNGDKANRLIEILATY